MSQENVEIVRRCYELFDRRDLSAILPLIDSDFEGDLSRNVFNPDVYRGHAGIERWLREAVDVWDDFHGEVTELIDAGDSVVAATTMHGTGKSSGVEVTMHVFVVWTLRHSTVARLVGGYRDRSEALEAVGLSE